MIPLTQTHPDPHFRCLRKFKSDLDKTVECILREQEAAQVAKSNRIATRKVAK